MKFVRATQQEAVTAVAAQLNAELDAGKTVLWLVCGGSNIGPEVKILHALHNTANLRVLLTDERYGAPGHPDSNYAQLRAAGFDLDFPDVLARGLPLAETAAYYGELLAQRIAEADVTLAVFGIGPDGHIAGILPGSPAAQADVDMVVGYATEQFTRLTSTRSVLEGLDHAFALAYGESKALALTRLQQNVDQFADLPSSLLYAVKDAYIYNDQITDPKEGDEQ